MFQIVFRENRRTSAVSDEIGELPGLRTLTVLIFIKLEITVLLHLISAIQ